MSRGVLEWVLLLVLVAICSPSHIRVFCLPSHIRMALPEFGCQATSLLSSHNVFAKQHAQCCATSHNVSQCLEISPEVSTMSHNVSNGQNREQPAGVFRSLSAPRKFAGIFSLCTDRLSGRATEQSAAFILPFGQKQQQFVAHVASTSGEEFLLEFDLGAGTSSDKWGKAAALCVSDHGVDGQRC